MEFQTGAVLQGYRILSLLGEGGMGEVYLAEETLLGRKVAIKRLNPLLTNDPQFSERFLNEARIQAKLIHPNIVALLNFIEENGVFYMIMEYAEGRMLKDVIATTGPIPEQRTLHIFRQLISALAYAHAKQIIHRDIKPSNIMIDVHDNIKVMDFGIARLMSDKHMTRTGAKLGTLYYMSPEQVLADKSIDHRTDIYSAGIVLYEMLTGKLPYTADTDSDFIVMKEITETRIPDPRQVYPHISDKTVATLNKATQKQRDTRYQDCNDLYQDCGESGLPHISSPSMTPRSSPIIVDTVKPRPQVLQRPIEPIEMVLVEGGTFNMGRKAFLSDESPVHEVRVSSFYMGKYQLSQKEWQEVMGENPSKFKGDDLPVEQVTWYNAVDYCNKRSLKEGLSPCYSGSGAGITCNWNANGYRLPTEAEWEYAARGGKQSKGYTYAGSNDLDSVAWYSINSGGITHPVGTKTANELGIFDMSGNVWEWCWDWYGKYGAKAMSNPHGGGNGSYRVLRGGGWFGNDDYCRVSFRYVNVPVNYFSILGVRVSRAIF